MAAAAAAAVLERLEALCCPPDPPLLPPDPPGALELLCRPSGPRLELLERLVGRVHPPLAAHLALLRDGPQEARLRELAALGAKLMLCQAEDLELLQGTAPPEQQLEFIQDLLDAAPHPGEWSGGSSWDGLLEQLLETPEGVSALRPPDLPPLPLEVPDSPPQTRPPTPELEAALGGSRDHLEQLQGQMAQLQLGGSPGPAPPPLGVLGGALASLAEAFGASDLGDPRSPPRGPPGTTPCALPVPGGLWQLEQVLGSVAQLGDTEGEVTRLGGPQTTQALESHLTTLRKRFGTPHVPEEPPRIEPPQD